jgi:hypothetical protein
MLKEKRVGYIRWPGFHLREDGVLKMGFISVFLWRQYKNITALFGP